MLALTCISGLAAGVVPAGLITGVLGALGLEVLIVVGFGGMIYSADSRPDKAIAHWWVALAPIWLAAMVSLAPIPIIDWFMRGGAAAKPNAQDALGIFFVCIIFNAFTVLAAVACAVYLWGPLAFQTPLRRWPTRRGLLWLLGLPVGLVTVIAIVSPTAAAGLAVAIGIPVVVPIATGLGLGMSAMPYPPRDLGARGADARVRAAIGFSIAFSAIACGLFNFWWYQACA